MNRFTATRHTVALAAGLALLLPLQAEAVFGGAGGLGDCTSFTTCTAATASTTFAQSRYNFDIAGSYVVPTGFNPGLNVFTDSDAGHGIAVRRAGVGGLCVNCMSNSPFLSSALAQGQSDFGISRVEARTSVGAQGTDQRSPTSSAHVGIQTFAEAGSVWRDVWRFSADGHFSAVVAIDGQSSADSGNGFFPSTYGHTLSTPSGDWFYDLMVWDVDNLSEDADGFPGPTLVASVRDRSGNAESRASFASALDLEFDFLAGVSYVVVAELRANARNGRTINLFHTARLDDVAWSGPAAMSTLSGHDYTSVPSAVPEPEVNALLLAGLALIGFVAHRRRRA